MPQSTALFMQSRCLHFMGRSYKIRMSWHPKRASNILSQTYNATSVFSYVTQINFISTELDCRAIDTSILTASGCNILYYAFQKINHFSRSKRKYLY